jgi:hypothetical protein
MDIAVDPRRCHAGSLDVVLGGHCLPRGKCAADGPQVQGSNDQKPPGEAKGFRP